MHINLELLESTYLLCAMLLEVPAMAAPQQGDGMRKRVISKPLRRWGWVWVWARWGQACCLSGSNSVMDVLAQHSS